VLKGADPVTARLVLTNSVLIALISLLGKTFTSSKHSNGTSKIARRDQAIWSPLSLSVWLIATNHSQMVVSAMQSGLVEW